MRLGVYLFCAAMLIANAATAGIREEILASVHDPSIAFLALLLGILGIYSEFVFPGIVAPGVAGGVLALLGVSAILTFPIRLVGVALLISAAVLFVFNARSRWRLWFGVGATAAMMSGAGTLIDGPAPISWPVAIGATLPFAAITVLLSSLADRARRNKVVPMRKAASTGD